MRNSKLTIIILTVLLLLGCILAPVGGEALAATASGDVPDALIGLTAGEDYVENELIFLANSYIEALYTAERYGAELRSYVYGVGTLTIKTDIGEALTRYESQSRTWSFFGALPELSPNYIYYACGSFSTPTDEYFANGTQWFHQSIASPNAWSAGDTGEGVLIAVLDSGVDPWHNDYMANLAGAVNFVSYPLADGDAAAIDYAGHGTHVSGLVAAESNDYGCVGVAPEAQLLSVKVLERDGSAITGRDNDILAGFNYAVAQGADVINMSFGSAGRNELFQSVINSAADKGVIAVAAAGNTGRSLNPTRKNYPAAYDNVISVAALTSDNVRADFSTYGDWIDVSAPGNMIMSDYSGYAVSPRDFAYMNGSSMSCPITSGAVALLLSRNAALRQTHSIARLRAVETLLFGSCAALAPSVDGMGAGKVDAGALCAAAVSSNKPKLSVKGATVDSFTVKWSAVSGATGYKVYRSEAGDGAFAQVCTATNLVFTDSGLQENTQYSYYVQPYAINYSVYTRGTSSSVVTAATLAKATPTPSLTVSPTPTPVLSPSATPSATPTAAPSATPTAAPSATPTAAPTATPSATPTATPSATLLPTPTGAPLYDSDPYTWSYDDWLRQQQEKDLMAQGSGLEPDVAAAPSPSDTPIVAGAVVPPQTGDSESILGFILLAASVFILAVKRRGAKM